MKPYYSHGGITIYNADCRDVLPTLGAFELLLTDMPYGEVNRSSAGLRNLDKGIADIATVEAHWLATTVAALCRSAYVFCGFGQVSDLHRGFKASGMTTRLCSWEKTNPSPMNGEHLWLSSIEPCVFGRGPGAVFNEHCASCVWRCAAAKDTDHTTGKPVKLMRRLIAASSAPGDLVVDLFCGGGTTLLAAKETGRRAVGIDTDERYCEMSAKRLAQEMLFPMTKVDHLARAAYARIDEGLVDEWGRERPDGPRKQLTPAQRRAYDLARGGAEGEPPGADNAGTLSPMR